MTTPSDVPCASSLETITLYWEKYHVRDLLGINTILCEWQAVLDDRRKYMILSMTTSILSERLAPQTFSREVKIHYYVPITWWDHFKKQYRNEKWMSPIIWWRQRKGLPLWNDEVRYKLGYVELTINPLILYPDLSERFPVGTTVRTFYHRWTFPPPLETQ